MAFSNQPRRLLFCLLAVTALAGCNDERIIYASSQPLRPVKVQYLIPDSGREQLSYAANLASVEQAELAFRVTGPVAAVNVVAGDRVRAGQPLMHLVPHDFDVQIAEYQARLADANASAKQARAEQARIKLAQSHDAIAMTSVEAADTAVKRATAGVAVVQQRLQIAEDRRAYSELKAPFDGVVAEVSVEAEEQVLVGQKVVVLQGLEAFETQFDVPPGLARQLTPGQTVQFRPAGSSELATATITEVRHLPNTLSRNFRITARLTDPLANAWPGLDGEVIVTLDTEILAGFWLPRTALHGSNDTPRVTLVERGRAQHLDVEVLAEQGEQVLLRGEGLIANSAVITSGADALSDEQPLGELIEAKERARI